jgi:uncharacterized protein YegL
MAQKQTPDVIVVLDESGSMSTMGNEPIQAMNALIKKQQEQAEDSKFSLYTFNEEIRKVYVDVPLSEMKDYTSYSPAGMTALFDCIGEAIDDKMKTDRKMNTVLIIITDGQDNSSKKFKIDEIKEKTKTQQEKYNWQILFLAANQDAFAGGASLGISKCSPYDQTRRGGLMNLVRACSTQVSAYRVQSASGGRPADITIPTVDMDTPTEPLAPRPAPSPATPGFKRL